MTPKQELLAKLADKSALIGIFGLGYVGLPLALRFSEAGYPVLGFDIDEAKIEALAQGRSYIEHIRVQKPLKATTDYSQTRECDALIICVPTPLKAGLEPDLSFVLNTVEALVPHLRQGQIVSLESTTYPGTTDEELRPRIEARGFALGRDVFLTFSPEREDPGNPQFETRTIPKVCGGTTPDCLEVGLALYGAAVDRVVPVSSTRAAEMTKLLENVHRAVNIALVNELKIVADRMGIDIHEVIRAAATKPFGFVPYWPGPGFGGHCIPIDPYYLAWKAREYGVQAKFVELAGEVNRAMPGWVVGKLAEALRARGKAVAGSRCLVLGIAYKKNVDDMRESPAVMLMELLVQLGAEVEYSDPHVPVFPKMREHRFDLESIALSPESIASYDVILLATNHDAFDYALLKRHGRLIVDTRGVFIQAAPNVIKA
ncbi:MAG TPA: nucleotide sugar dehydrogenase [Burkholderiales bacterium]|nr:nucleotide sugar dehydrogenase [Burkholderiales bacterium]